ncbi:hypothetical protein ES707_10874 [subsurface metagenome]
MKKKMKITGFTTLIVTVYACVLILLASRIGANNETLGDTGWTLDQFIKWAEKVQPVVGHRRWRYCPGGYVTISSEDEPPAEMNEPEPDALLHEYVEQFLYDIPTWSLRPLPPSQISGGQVWNDPWKELMDPNAGFNCGILIDVNNVLEILDFGASTYTYEWDFELPAPYEKLPGPVRKVIDSVNREDVGRFTGEILPYFARPVAICNTKNGTLLSSENVEVRLKSLSVDKLRFTVETEPFMLSDRPAVRGRIRNVTFLYIDPNQIHESKVSIYKPQKQNKENRQ